MKSLIPSVDSLYFVYTRRKDKKQKLENTQIVMREKKSVDLITNLIWCGDL